MKKKMNIRLQPKLIAGLVIMAAVLVLVLMPAISQLYRTKMEDYYSKLAFGQASVAAEFIDGDSIEKYYLYGEKDNYYEEVNSYLLNVKQKMGLKYFYVVVPEEEVMYYIWDSGAKGEDGVCELGDVDAYYGDGYQVMHDAFAVDAKNNILITNNEEYGYLASAYVAICDSTNTPVALASVDISMDMINNQIQQFILLTMGVTLLVLLMSTLAYYYYIRIILVRPLKVLHSAANGLVEDKMSNLEKFDIEIKTGDELENLADSFKYMVGELNEYIDNLSRITAEKERIGAELDVARHIQSSMLPCIFPAFPDKNEFDIYASMTPAKEVGGDFYDFFLVDDDHLAIVMADVSGKGVPAAMFMMISKTFIKSAAQSGLSPKHVLEKVNNQLCENNDAEMFVTTWIGILEISSGKLKCANAGHEYPVIMRNQEEFSVFRDKHGFVLAGMEDVRYKEYELQLEPGDKLFVYTDGVPEATNKDNVLYGMDRMVAALNKNRDCSCEMLLNKVHQDVNEFVMDFEQFDDITMLCIEIKQARVSMHEKNISPVIENIKEATAFFEDILSAKNLPVKTIAQVNVAVDEIFSNICYYSEATTVTLGCKVEEDQIVMRFLDNGKAYNPLESDEPDVSLSAGEREIGGLGIFMVKKTMDKVSYEYLDGLNILTLCKKL